MEAVTKNIDLHLVSFVCAKMVTMETGAQWVRIKYVTMENYCKSIRAHRLLRKQDV